MSRIGRMPIAVPAGVTVDIAENNQVTVKGPKGTLERVLPAEMTITKEGEEVKVTRPNDLKKMKSLHGLTSQANRFTIHLKVWGNWRRIASRTSPGDAPRIWLSVRMVTVPLAHSPIATGAEA